MIQVRRGPNSRGRAAASLSTPVALFGWEGERETVAALGEADVARSSDSGSIPLASIEVCADVAQLVEHFTRNEGVAGSIPAISTRKLYLFVFWGPRQGHLCRWLVSGSEVGNFLFFCV